MYHTDSCYGGYNLFIHLWQDEYRVLPHFVCKMADCPGKFVYQFTRYTKHILTHEELAVAPVLGSTQELVNLRKRAKYNGLWYVSLNFLMDSDRPTVAHPRLFPKAPQIATYDAIKQVLKAGIKGSVRQINKPTTLVIDAEYQHIATTDKKDIRAIEEALATLGLHHQRITGEARKWSPEHLANAFLSVTDGAPTW